MRLKIFGKTFIAFFAFALVSIIALSLVVTIYGTRYRDHINDMNAEVVAYAEAETAHVFQDAARVKVCDVASDAVEAAEENLEKQQRPIADLIADTRFASATAKVIFDHGSVGIMEPTQRLVVSHPDPDYEGKMLTELPAFKAVTYTDLWNLFDESVGMEETSGVYATVDERGVTREHVACFLHVPTLTSDNQRLVAFATAYRDDLGLTGDLLSGALRQKYAVAVVEATHTMQSMQDFLIILLFLMITVAIVFAWIFSRSLTLPLNMLANVCEHIAKGRFDMEVPEYDRYDEVAELARSVARMQKSLRAQAETITRQEDEVKHKEKDLEEALHLAEEHAHRLLDMN